MTYTAWIIVTGSLVGLTWWCDRSVLILRRMAMMADAISQKDRASCNCDRVFAYAFLSGIHMLIGAIVAGLLTAILVQWLHHRGVQQDASIGVGITTLFAIGVILISTSVGNVHLDVQHALMGEIAFIPWRTMELPLIGTVPEATFMLMATTCLVLLAIAIFYKEWKIT